MISIMENRFTVELKTNNARISLTIAEVSRHDGRRVNEAVELLTQNDINNTIERGNGSHGIACGFSHIFVRALCSKAIARWQIKVFFN